MSPLRAWPLLVRLVLAAGLGALAATGLAPFDLWYLTCIALVLLPLIYCTSERAAPAAWLGWFFGFGYFALALAWIVEPFFVDAARHGWMAPFALGLLAGGLALFWAVAFWAAAGFGRTPVARVLALVLIWAVVEAVRARIFTGFPWAASGQIWVQTDVARLLAFIGPDGLNLVTLTITLPLGLVLLPQSRRGLLGFAVAPAMLCIAVLVIVPSPPVEVKMTGKTVRLVQPNAPQHQKWDPEHIPVFFHRQNEFTAAEPKPDLVVWPEAALANRVEGVVDPLARIAEAANGAQVALGVLRPDADGFYNTLLRLDEKGAPNGVYDKHHLVPFGEYLPFGGFLERIGLNALAQVVPSGMLAGPAPGLIEFGELGRALPLICYEAVFAPLVSSVPERADFLLQITNDAWFGEWSGPYQHLAQAQMRAIEQGVPMVRVANTGVSAMIDPYGRIMGEIPLGQAGYVDLGLPAPLTPTIYAKYGEIPLLFVVFLWFFALCAHRMDVIGLNKD